MGRPPLTLTEAQKAEVETLAAVLSVQQIADYFGIARSTFYAIAERDPEIARNYRRGKARAIGSIAQSLIARARNGDTASMLFYLKTQAGWRETTTLEVLDDSQDVPTIDVTQLSDTALREIGNLLVERRTREARQAYAGRQTIDADPAALPPAQAS